MDKVLKNILWIAGFGFAILGSIVIFDIPLYTTQLLGFGIIIVLGAFAALVVHLTNQKSVSSQDLEARAVDLCKRAFKERFNQDISLVNTHGISNLRRFSNYDREKPIFAGIFRVSRDNYPFREGTIIRYAYDFKAKTAYGLKVRPDADQLKDPFIGIEPLVSETPAEKENPQMQFNFGGYLDESEKSADLGGDEK